MIRLIGALLVAFGAAWLGLSAAAELRKRVERLKALSEGLELLGRELWERGSPLPDVFARLSEHTGEPARTLFAQCAQACQTLEREPLSPAWQRFVQELDGAAALLPLGEVLGRYEVQGQREAIEQVCAALEEERRQAEKERSRMERVYQAIGLSGGGFLVILLL